MPCLGCFSRRKSTKRDMRRSTIVQMPLSFRRNSLYQIEQAGECEMDDSRHRNALQLRMQLALTEELSSETYGLEVAKKGNEPYEAQDFFAFKEILGSGATAVVFRAVFKPTGRVLAVKFIPNFKTAKTMVMRELQILKLANECRFLVDFHSHFRVGQNLYFVMEVCEGGTLDELIQPKHHMPAKVMKIYLKEIASALFFLHSLKVVHRDVAPPNLFLDGNAHLRLGDFGLCRIVDDPQGEIMTDCGKPYIKAPEMYQDKPCSFAMDWWSVGIVVYRFITGSYPFKTEKLTQGFQSVTKHQEKYPEWAFVDAHAKALCQGFLIKKPRDRLASENEEFVIKNHPYFLDVNWDAREDMVDLAKQMLESGEEASDSTVLQRLLTAVGVTPPSVHHPLPRYPPPNPGRPGPTLPLIGTIGALPALPALPCTAAATDETGQLNILSLLPKGDGIAAGGQGPLGKKPGALQETTV